MNRGIAISILSIVGALVLVGAGIFISKQMNKESQPTPRKKKLKSTQVVKTMVVRNQDVSSQLPVTGKLLPVEKIELFAEVSGVLLKTGKDFKEGTFFQKGDLLFQIDDTEAQANIKAQKSSLLNALAQLMPDLKLDYPDAFENWKAYMDDFDLDAPIKALPEPTSDQERYFVAARNLHNLYYNIKSQEIRLAKYHVYAPFSGVVTQANIYAGALVRSGQKLGELMNTASYELETFVNVRDIARVKVGNRVELRSDDLDGRWTGTVRRITRSVDPSTQMVKVFVATRGKNLREGIYLKGNVLAGTIQDVLEIPRDWLIDDTTVFVVNDSSLKRQAVDVVDLTEQTAIISKLENGTQLLAEVMSNAYEGMKVSPKIIENED